MFDAGAPIYLQIADTVRRRIVSGHFAKGEKIPAVREFALQMQVNPNTMQKAMAMLEEEGLLHSERTSGRFVTTDETVIQKAKKEATDAEIGRFLSVMYSLGYNDDEIPGLFDQDGKGGRK